MRLGFFLGSFNPIHLGHIKIAKYILDEEIVNHIKWIVSPHSPAKNADEMVSSEERLHMVQIATKDVEGFSVDDLEFYLPRPSYTIHTFRKLKTLYPKDKLYIILGHDNYISFNTWNNYQELLEYAELIVYPRGTSQEQPSWVDKKTLKQIIVLQDCPLYEMSSTEIRENLLEKGDSKSYPLSENVLSYIKQKGLYQVNTD